MSQPGQHVAAITYRVKQGDTLSTIAQLYDTTVVKIKSWNHHDQHREDGRAVENLRQPAAAH